MTKNFKPYIEAKQNIRELSARALILGLILAVIFGVGNAFLGLKVGGTVSASIPASVMSMALLRVFFKKVTILENNIVQTTASAGEGLAGGVIFTIPALIFLGMHPSRLDIMLISLLGGMLGVALMVPLREHIVVAEHHTLPFPEGTACAAILKAGQSGKNEALPALIGLIVGGFYRSCISIFCLWKETTQWTLTWYQKTLFSIDGTPALLGVGYLIGPRICAYMLSGSIFAWLVLIPMIHMFGGNAGVIFPADTPLKFMDAASVWSNYIRYIGAGAVAIGGILGLGSIFPIMSKIGRAIIDELTQKDAPVRPSRLHRDIPYKYLAIAVVIICAVLWSVPTFSLGVFSIVLLVFFAFLFTAVTSYTVGYIGTSSSPLSGMILTTVLITCCIYYLFGWTSTFYLVSALTLGSVVSIAIAIAADTSQDLKTGHLIGATPMKQQIAMLCGVCVSALFMGSTIYLLNSAYQLGSMQMPAPQATLFYLVSKGVLHGELPMTLMAIGAMVAVAMRILRIPVMPFAMGIYLPLSLNTAIALGGLVAFFLKKDLECDRVKNRGILAASGLVGGDSIFGVIAALFAVTGLVNPDKVPVFPPFVGALGYFIIAIFLLIYAKQARREERASK